MGTNSISVFICIFLFGILGKQNFFQTDAYSIHSRADQLRSLTNYEIVTPRRIDGRLRRDVSTFTENGHITEPSFIVQIGGEDHILDMHINDVLFADGFFERSYTESGSTIDTQPHRTDAVHMDDWNFSELYRHAEKILLHQNDLPGRKPKKKQKSKKWPRR